MCYGRLCGAIAGTWDGCEKMAAKRKKGCAAKAKATCEGARRGSALRFYGDEFIFDTVSGMFYRVSPTASFILRSLNAGNDPSRVADEVQAKYGIERAAAVRDIELLRNDLTAIGPFGGEVRR